MFISFEGIDGAGKSTVIEKIKSENLFPAESIVWTREPGATKISEAIRNILINPEYKQMDPFTESLLYAAARRQNIVENILPALKEGKLVLADRFVDSSLAYQGGGRNLGIEKVAGINSFALQDLRVDKVIYFRIDPKTALQRVKTSRGDVPDRLEMEHLEFFERIVSAYEELIKKDPDHFMIVDANKSPQDVLDQVISDISQILNNAK